MHSQVKNVILKVQTSQKPQSLQEKQNDWIMKTIARQTNP